MSWVLIITVLVNGQIIQADKSTYKTKDECLHVLKIAEAHPLFKQYGAKASCEKL